MIRCLIRCLGETSHVTQLTDDSIVFFPSPFILLLVATRFSSKAVVFIKQLKWGLEEEISCCIRGTGGRFCSAAVCQTPAEVSVG